MGLKGFEHDIRNLNSKVSYIRDNLPGLGLYLAVFGTLFLSCYNNSKLSEIGEKLSSPEGTAIASPYELERQKIFPDNSNSSDYRN